MYPVSSDYLIAIEANVIKDEIVGTITLKNDTIINITDADIEAGSLYVTEQCVSGSDLEVGTVVAAEMGLTLTNYEDPYVLDGARIALQYKLLIDIDTWEYVPLGYFYVTEIDRKLKAVSLKALDGLILFDVDLSGVSTAGTPRTIILSCCAKAGVTLETSATEFETFANYNIELGLAADNDQIKTCRDMVMWACQILGCFARMDRNSNLEIVPVIGKEAVKTINKNTRFSTKVSDFDLQVTGVAMTYNDIDYMQGSDELIMELEENSLLVTNADVNGILSNLLTQITSVQYKPFTSIFMGDPALQAGDYVTLPEAADIGDINVLITKSTWKYRSDHTIEGTGEAVKNVKTQENKTVTAIKAAVQNVVAVAQSLSQSTQLIKDAIGSNVLIRQNGSTNEILMMDNPDPEAAHKIWRWNLGGLGYSDNVIGTDNPDREYIVAMTMDGAINAQFIRAGLLSSINGKFVFDFETGTITSEAGLILTDSVTGLMTQLGSGAWEIKNVLTQEIIAKFTVNGAEMPTAIIRDQMYLGNTRFTPYEVLNEGSLIKRGIRITVDDQI